MYEARSVNRFPVSLFYPVGGITLQLPRSAFLAAQAILGCMIAQNLTGSILTTLAVNWPIVLAILLVTLLSSVVWVIAHVGLKRKL